MNVIVIVSDTFRRDHLGAYGNDWIRTPNLDKLASQSHVFDRELTGGFPTLPNRYDLHTGRFGFIEYDWSPLPRNVPVLAGTLSAAGYTTQMVLDTPHMLQNGCHFDRGFQGFHWVRGQENDRWRTSPHHPDPPCDPSKLRDDMNACAQHLRNVSHREYEEDFFPAQTMRYAAKWLEENRGDPFFLYCDTFDPHEPWDPPEWYVDLYDPGYKGEEVIYPRYAPADYLTKPELRHCRALYAGECTLVDTWAGYLLRRVEDLGLLDDTMIVFTTDHGFYIGEHNLTGKSLIWPGGHAWAPLYTEVAAIPLFVHMPGQTKQKRHRQIVQPADLMPTILDLLGVEAPPTVQGMSLRPLLEGKTQRTRQLAVTTPSLAHDPSPGTPSTITMGDWALIYSGNPDGPLASHLTTAVDHVLRPMRVPKDEVPAPELYNVKEDPGMTKNLFKKNREVAERIHRAHVRFLESLDMREEFLVHRTKL